MPILCYHAIDPHWRSSLAITPEQFSSQCAWLLTNKDVVTLTEAVASARPSGVLPGRQVALTFDDGLESLYHHAFPMLLDYGLPATVFVVAGTMTSGRGQADWIPGRCDKPLPTLSLEQILEMQEAGISFGSHSYAHSDLTSLSDEACRRDLKTSRETLEDALERPVRVLAYPRGLHDARVRRAARQAGFTHALGTSKLQPSGDLWGIPRIGVYPRNGRIALRAKTCRRYPAVRTSRPVTALARTLS
jgi:peptidoglycan/xylan/chitin deacetylase (PgdA/CDA1 family)